MQGNDLVVIISVGGVVFSILFGYIGYQKGLKTDSKAAGEEKGMILTKLNSIERGICNIERKQEEHDRRYTTLAIEIGRVDECAKSAHKRLDEHVNKREYHEKT